MLKTLLYICVNIFGVIAFVWKFVIRCKLNMKGTMRYLAGIAGQSGYGSKSTADQVTQDCSSLHPNLTAIVTGATSGIGAETARVLAKRGVRVVIPARNLRKAAQVKENIQKEHPKAEIIVLEIDLSSFASIKKFCSEFLSLDIPLNILINNAGKFSQKLEFSEDKFEMTFATNYLGHFLLTELLLEKLIETARQTGVQGRIVNVSSVIHTWVKKDNFSFNSMLQPKHYNATRAYAQSKLANIMHTKELAKQMKAIDANVTINAVHPGIVKTGIIRDHKGIITDSMFFIASKLLKTTSQGASTTCYVALSSKTEGVTGKYFVDCNESRCSMLANDDSEAHKLWKQTRALVYKRLRVQLRP
ncbi:NAD(P)-binding Rossmann-fold superfamily protein [Artemisia annua]|uniref:NAD(P)-binding Rossmann-fold superfamily protein n=1 Tax=Artemisia annua TaxID=35608 RepID=A0A2U1Q346_ARTAN|nr:NAD(P)-binding Rossmann-fold superfamily protein [Artemisia annua]